MILQRVCSLERKEMAGHFSSVISVMLGSNYYSGFSVGDLVRFFAPPIAFSQICFVN